MQQDVQQTTVTRRFILASLEPYHTAAVETYLTFHCLFSLSSFSLIVFFFIITFFIDIFFIISLSLDHTYINMTLARPTMDSFSTVIYYLHMQTRLRFIQKQLIFLCLRLKVVISTNCFVWVGCKWS